MTIDKEKLKALAESATKGERELWDAKTVSEFGLSAIPVAIPSQMVVLCHVFGSFNPMLDTYVGVSSYRKDADFIAAITPDVILALLAEIERLDGCDKAYAEAWEKARSLQSEMDEVVRERDHLQAESEALRKDLAIAKQSPLYSTRQDAKRYRWLRDEDYLHNWADVHVCDEHRRAEIINRTIDAAMAKEASHE